MFQVPERQFDAPAPMIAGFDILQIKGVWKISDHILICIFSNFDLNDTKLHEIKVFSIQKGLEVGDIFVRIHVAINIGLLPHDISKFICKKPFDDDVEFLLFIREFLYISRK